MTWIELEAESSFNDKQWIANRQRDQTWIEEIKLRHGKPASIVPHLSINRCQPSSRAVRHGDSVTKPHHYYHHYYYYPFNQCLKS